MVALAFFPRGLPAEPAGPSVTWESWEVWPCALPVSPCSHECVPMAGQGARWRPLPWRESSELERAVAEAYLTEDGESPSRWAGDLSCSAQGPGPDGPSSVQAPVGQEGNTGTRAFRKVLECTVPEASYMATAAGKDTCGYRCPFLGRRNTLQEVLGPPGLWCWAHRPSSPCCHLGQTGCSWGPGEGEGLGTTQWACSSIIGNPNDQGQLTLPEGHLASKGRGQDGSRACAIPRPGSQSADLPGHTHRRAPGDPGSGTGESSPISLSLAVK